MRLNSELFSDRPRSLAGVTCVLIHLFGLLIILPAIILHQLTLPLGELPGMGRLLYEKVDGESFQRMSFGPSGQFIYRWGLCRSKIDLLAKRTHVYASVDNIDGRKGEQFLVVYGKTNAIVAGGLPAMEYTRFMVQWTFIALIGVIVATVPLSIRLGRITVKAFYVKSANAVVRSASWLIPPVARNKSTLRGFEVRSSKSNE